ncbi:PfkB family carbohydrate kinase [Arthrobacter sp. efr-133-R2A-120]|uniref:PfkB family carbohydrate kinase n=1 Tax=Arthrobacter sp. efr-133-R2A-120 TaxID=3040277 RepID=UPI002551291F|nr:PfkB family carbohydrate kinase [Arthrobacter sp. efr-133-R2A-120]
MTRWEAFTPKATTLALGVQVGGKIAVLSHVVMDEIVDPDSSDIVVEIGGAGAFAAVGASIAGVAGSSLIVSGSGAVDRPVLSDWFANREIDTAGLFSVGEYGPHTRIEYLANGDRIETSLFGLEHFNAHTPLPANIPYPASELAGVYLFHDLEGSYWRAVESFRGTFSGPIMWEISRDACLPRLWPVVRERLGLVDVFSINRMEAAELLGASDLQTAVRALGGAGVPVVLRCGAKGSILIEGSSARNIGVAPTVAVDPTGGGNSYSGAYLAAYARSGDGVAAARVATAAASAVVSQYGAPRVDAVLRQRVAAVAKQVSVINQ